MGFIKDKYIAGSLRVFMVQLEIEAKHYETCDKCPATHIHNAINFYQAHGFVSIHEASEFIRTLNNHRTYCHFNYVYRGAHECTLNVNSWF